MYNIDLFSKYGDSQRSFSDQFSHSWQAQHIDSEQEGVRKGYVYRYRFRERERRKYTIRMVRTEMINRYMEDGVIIMSFRGRCCVKYTQSVMQNYRSFYFYTSHGFEHRQQGGICCCICIKLLQKSYGVLKVLFINLRIYFRFRYYLLFIMRSSRLQQQTFQTINHKNCGCSS